MIGGGDDEYGFVEFGLSNCLLVFRWSGRGVMIAFTAMLGGWLWLCLLTYVHVCINMTRRIDLNGNNECLTHGSTIHRASFDSQLGTEYDAIHP